MTRKSTIALVLILAVCVAGAFAAAVLIQVAQGMVLDVLDKTGDWYRVTLPAGGAGFINASVVDEIAGATAPAAPAAKTPPAAAQPVNRPAPPATNIPQRAPAPYAPASAPENRLFVTVGYLLGGAAESATVDFGSVVYQENASYSLAYDFAKGGAIDASVGYLVGPSWGVKVGGSIVSRNVTGTASFAIPHPLWMNAPREGAVDVAGMSLSETDLFLNLFYRLSFGALAVDIYGGPCYVLSTGTIVSGISKATSCCERFRAG